MVIRLGDRRSIEALGPIGPVGPAPSPGKLDSARARGELRLGFERRAGRTRMTQAFQSGCLRARVPHAEPGQPPCVVLINTGGGLTGGDRIGQSITWGAGAHAVAATQAAEKIYRSAGGEVEIDVRLKVAEGASAEWLPQETILFDRARLSRSTRVCLARDAAFLGVEMLVLGRAAMGEVVREASLSDTWRIRREGRLVYADAQRLEGPIDLLMDRAAIGAGARAMAVMIHASAQALELLAGVRAALAPATGRTAASAWNGLLVARFLAPDGHTLKRDLLPALALLRGGRALPRVWTC